MRKLLLLAVFGTVLPLSALAQVTALKIAEIYPGGGNSGATYKQDYVVIFNSGATPVSLNGLSVQYGGATTSGLFPSVEALNNVSIPAGGYYTLCTTNNPAGDPGNPPVCDETATSTFSMATTGGKVALVNGTTAISSTTPGSALDFVGYGTANAREDVVLALGTTAANAPAAGNNTTAIRRNGNGATDTNQNSADFTAVTFGAGVNQLPVELVSWTATASGNGARLAWTTASETNNAGFALEMRADTDDWRQVAFVAGRGTTQERSDYAHTVAGLAPGRYAFRLRQVDFDGAATYSATVEVRVGLETPLLLDVRGSSVRLSAREAQAVRVEAFDVLGRRVAVLFEGAFEAGQARALDASAALAAGVYVVRALGTHARASRTLIVQ